MFLLIFLLPTKLTFFFPVSYYPVLPTHARTQMHIHTGQCNKQRSIGMLNTSSVCYRSQFTCTFRLLLEMFHENNILSQGCSAPFVFVPGLVRIAVLTQSEAVSSLKLVL